MSIASSNNRNDYVGNGAVSTYAYTYKIFDSSDVKVTIKNLTDVETSLSLTTDYTVTGVNNPNGGTIVLVDSGQSWLTLGKLTFGFSITIRRVLSLVQETDIRNQGAFYQNLRTNSVFQGRYYASAIGIIFWICSKNKLYIQRKTQLKTTNLDITFL